MLGFLGCCPDRRTAWDTRVTRRSSVSGRKVVDVARDLGVSYQTIYNWRLQDRVDRGELEGTSTLKGAQLKKAKKLIAALGAELAI